MATRKKLPRTVVELVWNGQAGIAGVWLSKVVGRVVAFHFRKKDAIRHWSVRLHEHTKIGVLGQLRVHDKAGKFEFERTYGADPKRTKG